MAITYPLSMPTSPGLKTARLTMRNVVGISESPTTLAQQVLDWNADAWLLEAVLPRISTRAQAEPWNAFLAALKGPVGTFLAGDPAGRVAQGQLGKNLLQNPEQFDNAIWTKDTGTLPAVVTANAASAPQAGLSLADKIAFPGTLTAGQTSQVVQLVPLCAAQRSFTFSVWMKADAGCTVTMRIEDASPYQGPAASADVAVTTGWQRFSVSGAFANSPGGSIHVILRYQAVAAAANVYAWGAQLEPGLAMGVYQQRYGDPICDGGALQRASSMTVRGLVPNATGLLLAGDYFQLGSGTSTRLYKLLGDINADATGKAGIDFWPGLRGPLADGQVLTLVGAQGLFRLASVDRGFDLDEILQYPGLAFSAREAL